MAQGKFANQPSALLGVVQQKIENNTGMPDEVKGRMETVHNADFSDVRIHSDSSKAPAVGALAYTQGSDIHFAPGQFSPNTAAGKSLLGHELTHVVQQREGRVQPTTEVGGMPVNDDISLEKELEWFSQVLETRINLYFGHECAHQRIEEIPLPNLTEDHSEYAALVQECNLSTDERLVLILALIPHIRPQELDTLFTPNKNLDRGFTEFGGWKGKTHGGFLPTCETASFILAGNNLEKRFEVLKLFQSEHVFAKKDIIRVEHQGNNEPFFSGTLTVSTDYLHRLTSGICQKPDYSINFPAKLITTKLGWDDLVLDSEVLEEIDNITLWLKHSRTIMEEWGMEKAIKPGYRSLFYGPPGTGKTLTATLIGASVGADVYRIDLSMVVSKYIGETEKNLANVFDQAQHKN